MEKERFKKAQTVIDALDELESHRRDVLEWKTVQKDPKGNPIEDLELRLSSRGNLTALVLDAAFFGDFLYTVDSLMVVYLLNVQKKIHQLEEQLAAI